jgi:outer membrane protein OmpA-like peptidoglycan-associated protein
MRPTRLLLLLLLFAAPALLMAPRAEAQMIPRSVELDAFGGYYAFMSRGGFAQDQTVKLENIRDDLTLGGRFGINFTEVIGFEASVGVLQGKTFDTLRRVWYVNAHFDAIVHLPFPYVVPYFAVGAGFQHYNIRPVYAGGEGPADFDSYYRDPYPDSERLPAGNYLTYRSADGDFLIDAGGGAKFLLFQKEDARAGVAVGLRIDVRYKLSIGPADSEDGVPTLEVSVDEAGTATADSWRGTFNHVEIGGGVFVNFGGGIGPDRDRDGISNRDDECPDDPEDKDDFEDEDGCPDLDNDKDNVPDDSDRCPMDPEDRDGFEDEDGCPEVDNDQDGLLDADDRCPSRAEDEDGFEDMDGCPDLDNDQDGWLDPDDDCPTAPENFNSYLDDDGCPDEVPTDLSEFAGAIPAIQFKVGSAQLKSSAKPILDKAARALMRYPDLHVEIGGHASADGDDEYNMALSQDRVLTVRDYLIDRGIDPDRLTARGYGETRPIADNGTEEGRIANRRVEFTLTQQTRRRR